MTFKKEFEDKLNELGVKEAFEANVLLDLGVEDLDKHLDSLNEECSFYEFVLSAFTFLNTNEGVDFWFKIANS